MFFLDSEGSNPFQRRCIHSQSKDNARDGNSTFPAMIFLGPEEDDPFQRHCIHSQRKDAALDGNSTLPMMFFLDPEGNDVFQRRCIHSQASHDDGTNPLHQEENLLGEKIQNSLEAEELMLGLGMMLRDLPTPMKDDIGYEADVDTPDPDQCQWEMVCALTEEMKDEEDD
ncbi:hypothetical protein H0H92_009566 [Tricholoma furcatifolium]|nr:hypothetical protein H0H92_009566 [Tricholoma furcatifolium]